MNWFRRKTQPQIPAVVNEVKLDPDESTLALARAMNVHHDAQAQAAHAHAAVAGLTRSRVRNGFAPAIEQSIINRYLGEAT